MKFGGGNSELTMKMIMMALIIMFAVPTFFSLYVPMHMEDGEYDKQIAQLEQDYYLSSGRTITAATEVWGLVGIYEPFDGGSYGYTPDGWIYGAKVVEYSPEQYNPDSGAAISPYKVQLMDNGLYYYTSVSEDDLSHTAAKWIWNDPDNPAKGGYYDYSEASLYTNVAMCNEHISTVFFTPGGKTITDSGYYYEYTGYRYAFGPLRSYQTEVGGIETTVEKGSSSLSLIWYQYSTYNGIAGQLTISGSDTGLSYLTATDILREFNQATYSSTFDMVFNNVSMHLTIRLDAIRIANGVSPEACYNQGYWSVMVTSDAIASSSINNATYDFNLNNILETLYALFSFNITEKYEIDGWVGVIASLMISMPLYAAIIVIALDNQIALVLVAILGVIQSLSAVTNWWPF